MSDSQELENPQGEEEVPEGTEVGQEEVQSGFEDPDVSTKREEEREQEADFTDPSKSQNASSLEPVDYEEHLTPEEIDTEVSKESLSEEPSILTIRNSLPRQSQNDPTDEEFEFLGAQPEFVFLEEEVEPEEIPEESSKSDIDICLLRQPYYKQYRELREDLLEHQAKNILLQKAIIKYLRKRKTENITGEIEPFHQLLQYNEKLRLFEKLAETSRTKYASLMNQEQELRQKRNEKKLELETLFKAMQSKEENIGRGLIYSKTNVAVADKVIERYIKRQSQQMEIICNFRLQFIKLKAKIQEKLDDISKVDYIGDNRYLADYEQLKCENRNFADKIEEKDEELAKLRVKVQKTTQIIAHIREKSACLDADVDDLNYELEMVTYNASNVRGELGQLNHTRNEYRQLVNKMKEESGLLLMPTLLKDMHESQNILMSLENELAQQKQETKSKSEQIRQLRKNMGILTSAQNNKSFTALSHMKLGQYIAEKKSTTIPPKPKQEASTFYKRRPSLIIPFIKDQAFDGLITIKPMSKIYTKSRR